MDAQPTALGNVPGSGRLFVLWFVAAGWAGPEGDLWLCRTVWEGGGVYRMKTSKLYGGDSPRVILIAADGQIQAYTKGEHASGKVKRASRLVLSSYTAMLNGDFGSREPTKLSRGLARLVESTLLI
jgi:hypothetical protein